MLYYFLTVLFAICTAVCLYFVYLAIQAGDSQGVWFFIAFGGLFGVLTFSMLGKRFFRRVIFSRSGDEGAGGEPTPQPTGFVPHWFMMTLLLTAGILILLAIVLPRLLR